MKNSTSNFEGILTAFLTKLNILLLHDPGIMLFSIYPNELKIYVHTRPCRWMFTAAVFKIAQNLQQPRCPSVGEWINKHLDNGILFNIINK
jgi:hypothetical protein